MSRIFGLILLPIALLAAACGGSSDDSAVHNTDDEPIAAAHDLAPNAGPDGIYGTIDDVVGDDAGDGDDAVVGDVEVSDGSSDEPLVSIDSNDISDSTGNTSNGPASYPDSDDLVIGGDGVDGGIGDNAIFGALNPFSFLGGAGVGAATQEIDPDLGSALLVDSDIPSGFVPMGEFSFSAPSEFGDMDMVARMWARGLESDEFGAMIMSAVMMVPPEAMGEIDELTSLTEADLAEIQGASDEFGMDFARLEILDADGLGDGGFGMHMELDFGAFFSAFGAPEEDEGPTGIAMDMYAFAVGDRVLMVMVMWPMGEPQEADGRNLAEIMAARG